LKDGKKRIKSKVPYTEGGYTMTEIIWFKIETKFGYNILKKKTTTTLTAVWQDELW
jgi:hypothetical protein